MEALLISIVGIILTIIAYIALIFLEYIAGFLLMFLEINLFTLEGLPLWNGFTSFGDGIRALAVGIASVIVLWQLVTVLFGPFLGTKQESSVGMTVGRALVFIPLTYVIQGWAMIALRQIQLIYTAFLANAGIRGSDGALVDVNLSGQLNLMSGVLSATQVTSGGEGVEAAVRNMVSGVMLTAVVSLIMCIVIWNLIKLLLETAQRFVAMVIYAYLSPLAIACGVGSNSIEITKRWVGLFLSSGILWILNTWSVGVALVILRNAMSSIEGGPSGIIMWCVMAYGFMKVAQQLDDVFNAVGANNVRFSGSMLGDMLEMRSAFNAVRGGLKMAGNAVKAPLKAREGLRSRLQSKIDGGKFFGKDAKQYAQANKNAKPIATPGAANAAGAAGAAGAANAATKAAGVGVAKGTNPTGAQAYQPAKNIAGQYSRTGEQQDADKWKAIWHNSTPGLAMAAIKAQGAIKAEAKAERLGAAQNIAAAKIDRALSHENATDKANALKGLTKEDLSHGKAYVGQRLGLGENQQVAGLAVDKEGQMLASVATKTPQGLTMSTVTGINNSAFGGDTDGHGVPKGHTRAPQLDDTGKEISASAAPVIPETDRKMVGSFTDSEGNKRTFSVERADADYDKNSKKFGNVENGRAYNVTSDTGNTRMVYGSADSSTAQIASELMQPSTPTTKEELGKSYTMNNARENLQTHEGGISNARTYAATEYDAGTGSVIEGSRSDGTNWTNQYDIQPTSDGGANIKYRTADGHVAEASLSVESKDANGYITAYEVKGSGGSAPAYTVNVEAGSGAQDVGINLMMDDSSKSSGFRNDFAVVSSGAPKPDNDYVDPLSPGLLKNARKGSLKGLTKKNPAKAKEDE